MKVYLDNNATTKIDPLVVKEMLPYLNEFYGNASSMHDFGAPAAKALDTARERVRAYIGAEKASEIIFTSCAMSDKYNASFNAQFPPPITNTFFPE